jgi:hypothetical protein
LVAIGAGQTVQLSQAVVVIAVAAAAWMTPRRRV